MAAAPDVYDSNRVIPDISCPVCSTTMACEAHDDTALTFRYVCENCSVTYSLKGQEAGRE